VLHFTGKELIALKSRNLTENHASTGPKGQAGTKPVAFNEGVTLKRSMLRDQVKKILCDAILKGELKPGERVVETRIARELSVSQAPVREAILELEQMGLVKIRPYQGAYVSKPSYRDYKEAYTLRAVLECEAVREACRVLTEEGVLKLSLIVENILQAADKGDYHEFIKWDNTFHERILKIAGNRLLMKIWQQIHMTNLTYVSTAVSKRTIKDLAVKHQDILVALKQRNCREAEELMRGHILERMEEFLRDVQPDE
jgi:DNA-binding GntR family transcriptional regulator